jgi:hypothetical protein
MKSGRYREAANVYARPEGGDEGVIEERPLMILRVEDKYNVVHILKFYKHEDPRTVAQSFGLTHGLDHNAIGSLTDHIINSLNNLENRTQQKKLTESSVQQPVQGLTSSNSRFNQRMRPSTEERSTKGSAAQLYIRPVHGGFNSTANKKSTNIELDTDPINNGEKNYIVGKRRTEVEMYFDPYFRKKAIEKANHSPQRITIEKSLTFKPKICRNSEQIASRLPDVRDVLIS